MQLIETDDGDESMSTDNSTATPILKALVQRKLTKSFSEGRRLIHNKRVWLNHDLPVINIECFVFPNDTIQILKGECDESEEND